MTDRLNRWSLVEFLERVADCAEAVAAQAGVGGMETAGAIISYLVDHQDDIEPFMVGGVFELPERWLEQGRLTWHASNGSIVRPEDARKARSTAARAAA